MVKAATLAPSPRVTKIIGNAQQIKVPVLLNKVSHLRVLVGGLVFIHHRAFFHAPKGETRILEQSCHFLFAQVYALSANDDN